VARNHARLTPRQRVMHELTEFAILTAYLYVTLGAVILMKASVLHDQGVGFVPWGTAILKARGAGEVHAGRPCNEDWRALLHPPADLADAA
jgi:hypothetical protein